MSFSWKAAGISYNAYLAIAARTVRRSLKPEQRLAAERRADSEMKVTKWTAGKQGEPQDLLSAKAPAPSS